MAAERISHQSTISGDRALEVVDRYRSAVEDHFTVEALSNEFPRFVQYLGSDALYLANAADNQAGTFKWRGAIVGATELYEQGERSILVPSAGNALRGSALAAKFLGMDIHGVVPRTAPRAKSEGAREELWNDPRFQLHVVGESFNDSLSWALRHPELGALLHPFDNPNVARGQGTIADDIFSSPEGDSIEHIVVEIGGGGLAEGILRRRDELERKDVIVHAIQASGSNSLELSLQRGEITPATAPNLRYGGSAVSKISERALEICSDADNFNVYTVSDDEVDRLIDDYEADRRDSDRQATPNFEPTTLVAIAGLRQVVQAHPNERIVVIGSGYNDSLRPLSHTNTAFRTWR